MDTARHTTCLIDIGQLLTHHDAPGSQPSIEGDLWRWIAANHEHNRLLWAEEDLARRTHVCDAEIATNKRNIDRFNQARNDAVERIDEVLLEAIGARMSSSARLHSETAGAMVDRLSILALKIRAMRAQAERRDAGAAHTQACEQKLGRLLSQRSDLADCLAALLDDCLAGRAHFKRYRQFKMYNDAMLNPQLYGAVRG